MKTKTFTTKNMVLCAAGAALMAVCSWITIPVGSLTFTMQCFSVFLLLLVLGGKLGTLSILVWLLLGAVGAPVFSSFRGGVGVLLGTTGGYIWGFLLTGLVFWAITAHFPRGKYIAMVAGQLVTYACGTAWFLYAYAGESAMTLWSVLCLCVFPYLVFDVLKLVLAERLSVRLNKALKM